MPHLLPVENVVTKQNDDTVTKHSSWKTKQMVSKDFEQTWLYCFAASNVLASRRLASTFSSMSTPMVVDAKPPSSLHIR